MTAKLQALVECGINGNWENCEDLELVRDTAIMLATTDKLELIEAKADFAGIVRRFQNKHKRDFCATRFKGLVAAETQRLRLMAEEIREEARQHSRIRGGHGVTRAPAEIVLSNRQLHEITNEVTAELRAHNEPPVLFVRAEKLVHVIRSETGRASVEVMNEAGLRGVMARSARFIRYDRFGEKKSAFPPIDVVKDIGACDPGSWPFPPLLAVVEVPTLRPDGTVLQQPGYDQDSRLFYAPAATLKTIQVPETPTESEAHAALRFIDEAIGEFPYADAASKANFLGLLLTPVVRPAMASCVPLALLDAPMAGTGKSLLVDVLAMITTGRPAAMSPYPYSEEEMQKQIGASLAASRQLICFDNLEGDLRSPVLALALTAKVYEARILGISKNMIVPNLATWVLTGNNIRPAGDMPRRCYQIRLNAKSAKPYLGRKFKHKNLLRWVEDHRAELLGALLMIARFWYASGCPEYINSPMGTFDEWHQKVGSMVSHAGVPGFLANFEAFIDVEDESPRQWGAFLCFLSREYRSATQDDATRYFAVSELMDRIGTAVTSPLRNALPADIADCLEKKVSHRIAVGRMFAKRKESRFEYGEYQYWLERDEPDSEHKGAALWKIRRAATGEPIVDPT